MAAGLFVPSEASYARTSDGLRIAFQTIGRGTSDIVVLSDMSMSLEGLWDDTPTANALRRLATSRRLILFDHRGRGTSDSNAQLRVPTLEEMSEDIKAVMAACGSTKATVIAHGETGAIGIMFSATYPAIVEALVLINSHARLPQSVDYPFGVSPKVQDLMRGAVDHWGSAVGVEFVAPSRCDEPPFRDWYAKALRLSGSPALALSRIERNLNTDVRALLPLIQAPTLVIHTVDNHYISVEHGRYIARHVPNARKVELAGSDHVFPALNHEALVGEIEEFLTGSRMGSTANSVAATVLITDIVESTEMLSKIGDQEWTSILDRHDTIVRRSLQEHSGTFIKGTGDGVLSVFDGPARAVHCALEVRNRLHSSGISIRAGIHTGELQFRSHDVAGIAVHVAARVESLADPGEVLVSQNVTDLVAGSGITFARRGEHTLKGVPGSWSLYAVQNIA